MADGNQSQLGKIKLCVSYTSLNLNLLIKTNPFMEVENHSFL